MLISEPYYVFPYVYWFLSKTTKYDGNKKKSFPEHVPEFFCVFLCACACDDAIGGTMEESGRESQVKKNPFFASHWGGYLW